MAQARDRLSLTLLVLRLLTFGVFLMWTLEKFVNPSRAAGIYDMAYSIRPDSAVIVLLGVIEAALIAAFVVGIWPRLTRGVLLAVMGIATVAPTRFLPTPFDDHILLYYAAFPMLAVVFTLYYLRDYDTLGTIGASTRGAPSAPSAADPRVPLCLWLIRLGVFFVLFMWTMDKFLHPMQTSRIFANFYNVGGQDPILGLQQLSYETVYLIGAVELVLIFVFLLGIAKRFTYALIFVLHTLSTLAPWERFLVPLTSHTLLFLSSFVMLGGCFALYYLRDRDVVGVLRLGSARGGEGAAVARPSAGAWLAGATPLGQWDRPVQIGTALTIVVALYVLGANASEWRYERANGPALVAELERRYAPSEQLLSLNPEMETGEWTAMWRSANCTFSNPTIGNCWEIHFIVWVPNLPGNVMSGRRQVEGAWIVDADALEFRPDGNASRYFRQAHDLRSER